MESDQRKTTIFQSQKSKTGMSKNYDMYGKKQKKTDLIKKKTKNNSEMMARPTVEHMAFKSGGFPSPQMIFMKTDSIPLDDYLEIRRLVIDQGHYITSVTDASGKFLGRRIGCY